MIALTRVPSPKMNECELSFVDRTPIDVDLLGEQHAAYETVVGRLGCSIVEIEPAPECPDSVFVEDTAIVLDEVAVIARPGAASRRPEVAAVADVLRRYKDVATIEAPATLDGGDVLVAGSTIYVGTSGRTNPPGFDSLAEIGGGFGYAVVPVPIHNCLHLKSAVTLIGERLLLVDRLLCDAQFPSFEVIETSPDEHHAANALLVSGRVIYPSAFPKTARKLERLGIELEIVNVSEIQKAEGGVTCCSIVFES